MDTNPSNPMIYLEEVSLVLEKNHKREDEETRVEDELPIVLRKGIRNYTNTCFLSKLNKNFECFVLSIFLCDEAKHDTRWMKAMH